MHAFTQKPNISTATLGHGMYQTHTHSSTVPGKEYEFKVQIWKGSKHIFKDLRMIFFLS